MDTHNTSREIRSYHDFIVDHDEVFCAILQNSLNSILKAASQDQLQASPYNRSDKRTDCCNVSRERDLKTHIGRITLTYPTELESTF